MKKKILSFILCLSLCFGAILPLASCGNKDKDKDDPTAKNPDALVIMSDELDGLFNPFFSTTAADGNIVSMTQIGMLGMNYVNGEVQLAYGKSEPVATLDYEQKESLITGNTTYTFVIKNGIKFSDGHPLTIEDVLFNLYVYLDPVYTGSSTMYSTNILGLADYRAQKYLDGDSNDDNTINETASAMASTRITELINIFTKYGKQGTSSYDISIEDMKAAIKAEGVTDAYQKAVSSNYASVTYEQLIKDYDKTLELFKKELERDYKSAQEAYPEQDEPYKTWWTQYFSDPIFRFMCYEGFVEIKYAEDKNGKPIRTEIESIVPQYGTIKTMEEAIEYVFEVNVTTKLHEVLTGWATAAELKTEYQAIAKSILLESQKGEDGSLTVPSISGIVSLAHNTDLTEYTIGENTYKIASASERDQYGAPLNSDEYDILQITIKNKDPKAHWNFSFSVAPQHYYGDSAKYPVDIKNNKFGVSWGDQSFMSAIVQDPAKNGVPVGAGAYMATNAANSSNPKSNEFYSKNVVYFKANPNFFFAKPKIDKVRYQVVSASNAIGLLKSGNVHFISPQYTNYNITQLDALKSQGIIRTSTDQLGYGYIGVSADKIPDINLRKAIMCAMNINLSLEYYTTGTADAIYYPMSTVSWAYPKDNGKPSGDNGKDYPVKPFNDEDAKALINSYMNAAGVSANDPSLNVIFTIAGSNASDHPTYRTFLHAEKLLEECGWDITVTADANALKKLSTGSLAVWAAAWGSAIDPDLYQVYHKNSTASSTMAWGYDAIKADPTCPEYAILSELSEKIDDARETTDQDLRAAYYKEALELILDLAIELPVYQRDVLYAYNSKVIKESSLPSKDEINPYSSPLDRIWEIEFAN